MSLVNPYGHSGTTFTAVGCQGQGNLTETICSHAGFKYHFFLLDWLENPVCSPI